MSAYLLLVVICFTLNGVVNSAGLNTCYDGWMAFGGSCYLFAHNPATFTEAEHYCRQHHNSHLVHVNTDLENRFIKDRLRDLKTKTWWMGLTDEDIEGVFKWFDTDTVANFTDWNPGQPDVYEEDCVSFWSGFDFSWGDIPCNNQYTPICEMEAVQTCDNEIIG
ncbi:hypothetical protein ACF0H5_022905 [Mactra antiquata]